MGKTLATTTRTGHRGGRRLSWLATRGLTALAFMAMLTVLLGGIARADIINADYVIDATVGGMSLTAGGSQGSASYVVDPTNGDGKNGCNLTGSTTLTVNVSTTNASVATVSPSSVTFDSCGDVPTVTVTPVGTGNTAISLSQVSNSTGATFNLAPATFTVYVGAAPVANTAPTVTVTGVTNTSYYIGFVPVAYCDVVDTEDGLVAGVNDFAATLSATSNADGTGTQTASCNYTDLGGRAATPASMTYTILPPPNTAPSVAVTSVADGVAYEIGSVPSAGCAVTDTEDGPSSFAATLSAISGPLAAYGLGSQTATCDYTDLGGLAAFQASATYSIVDTIAPVITFVGKSPAANSAGWNNVAPVTLSWTCTDGGSGVVSSLVTQQGTAEGTTSLTGTCTDNAGLTATDTQTVSIDTVAPSISATADRDPNPNGWYGDDVTVSFTCSDAGSGLASACPSPIVVSTDTVFTGQNVSASITDVAGNSTTSNVVNVKLDESDPTITLSSDVPSGWSNDAVTVTWDCEDALSGVVTATDSKTAGAEGENQTLTGTCTDLAGNTASDTVEGIDIDLTAPTLVAAAARAPNANGWYNAAVTVSFTCTDALSGPVGDPIDQKLDEEGTDLSASDTCFDVAGNESVSATVTGINIDTTAPTVVASATANGSLYTAGMWTKHDVTVSFTCSDDLSGPEGDPDDQRFTSEGSQSITSVTCLDEAGNESAAANFGPINIDKTAPTNITFVGGGLTDGATYYFGAVPAGPTSCTADGGLSGLQGCELSGTANTAVGSYTLTATATDKAGNQDSATLSYRVLTWTIKGFYAPVDMNGVVNTVKAGSTVPLKFEVFAGSTELTSTSVVTSFSAVRTSCATGAVEDTLEVTTTGGTSLRYDATGGQYIQNWQTPKSGAGSCYTVTMTTADGSSITALFKLK